jgi:hypothetical protein
MVVLRPTEDTWFSYVLWWAARICVCVCVCVCVFKLQPAHRTLYIQNCTMHTWCVPAHYYYVPAMACNPPEKSPPEMAALAATTNVNGSTMARNLVVGFFSLDFTTGHSNSGGGVCRFRRPTRKGVALVVEDREYCSRDNDDDDGAKAEQRLLLLCSSADRLATTTAQTSVAVVVQPRAIFGYHTQWGGQERESQRNVYIYIYRAVLRTRTMNHSRETSWRRIEWSERGDG